MKAVTVTKGPRAFWNIANDPSLFVYGLRDGDTRKKCQEPQDPQQT